MSGKSGGDGSGSSSGGGGGNGSTGTITDKAVNNTKTDTYEEYAYKTSQSAWKRGDYLMWFEYRLKAGLGNDFDRKSEATLKPFAEFVADSNPLISITNIISGLYSGQNIYDEKMDGWDYIGYLASIFGRKIKMPKSMVSIGIVNKHHVFPMELYKKYFKTFLKSNSFKQYGKMNLRKLVDKFHRNHPAYTEFVRKRIDYIKNNSKNIAEDLRDLNYELRREISKAYKEYLQSETNLNDYYQRK